MAAPPSAMFPNALFPTSSAFFTTSIPSLVIKYRSEGDKNKIKPPKPQHSIKRKAHDSNIVTCFSTPHFQPTKTRPEIADIRLTYPHMYHYSPIFRVIGFSPQNRRYIALRTPDSSLDHGAVDSLAATRESRFANAHCVPSGLRDRR